MRLHTLLASCLLATGLAAQTTWWVDPINGNDANSGSYPTPLMTLTHAVSLAGPYDRIHLLSGVYGPGYNGETLPITLGFGVTQDHLTIRGVGPVLFDLGGSATTALRLAIGASFTRITNITFSNSDQLGWWTRLINSGSGVDSGNAATDIEIDRCTFANLNRGIVLWNNDNVQNWRVHDNLFENLSNDAILEYSGNNEFYNNTFHQGAWKAYISDSPTSHCYNNLILNYNIAFECNNTATQLSRFQSNWTYQCTTDVSGSGMTTSVPPSNVFGVDPQLVSIATGDYHPLPTSPLIDQGNPNIFARGDRDNVSRIVDTNQSGNLAPEIGCYEVSPVSMSSYFDPSLGVLFINTASTQPGMYGFVLFCFNDGLIQFPGQGPILIDINTYIGNISSAFPGSWILNLNGVTLAPGTRIVMQALGLGSAPSVIGGNQVWVQL